MIVPLRQAGKLVDPPVTRQAIEAWIKAGCDCRTPDGMIDTEKAQAWRLMYRRHPDTPGANGGRRRRKPFNPFCSMEPTTPTPTTTTTTTPTAPATDASTLAEIKRQQEALKLAAMKRAEQLAAGTLVDAEQTERALRAACMDVRAKHDQIPARASRRIQEELGLAAELILPIRAILAKEIDLACRGLCGLTHDGSTDDQRTPDAGDA